MDTAPNNTHTQRIGILLMCIVDTVAQVAARGQWRPLFDISGPRASLHFRPAGFSYANQKGPYPRAEQHEARFSTYAEDDAQEQIEALEAMLAFARHHLGAQPEVAA